MQNTCIICKTENGTLIRINSMESYMQFRVGKMLGEVSNIGFICLDCREQLRKELEGESGIKID